MTASITIAIPTFNRAGILRQTIDETLEKMPENFSLLVLDNGSTDATESILTETKHPRFDRLRDPVGTHVKDGFFALLDYPKTDYVLLMSDEDRIAWEHSRQLEELLETEQPNYLATSFRHENFFRHGEGSIKPNSWFRSAFYCSGMVFRREPLREAIARMWPLLHASHFLEIYGEAGLVLHMLKHGKAQWLPVELTRQKHLLPTEITMSDGSPYWRPDNRKKLKTDYLELLTRLEELDPDSTRVWQEARSDNLINSWG